jgi:glutamate-1-semialdehyde aminotransferase
LLELRRVTKEIGAFLIFDEVITGFRLAAGGAHEFYGVIPDVSTYGKVAGGGLPFGAVGGTDEAMRWMEYDPGLKHSILVAGTFNGNPLVTAAGTAVLRRLKEEPQLYARLNAMGERVRSELNRFAAEGGYPAIATGAASIFALHAVRGPVRSIRDLQGGNHTASAALGLLYRKNGLHLTPSHAFLSAAHTDDDIPRLIEVYTSAMKEMRVHGVW